MKTIIGLVLVGLITWAALSAFDNTPSGLITEYGTSIQQSIQEAQH